MFVTTRRGREQLHRRHSSLARQVRATDEGLETAALTAPVQGTVGVDDHVPDLPGGAVASTVKLAVDAQTAADPGRPRDVDNVAGAASGTLVKQIGRASCRERV